MNLRIFLMTAAIALLAACAAPGGQYSNQRGYNNSPNDGYARCQSCGVVERIDQAYGQRQSSGGGAVLGGIIGGIVGNQVGSGSGRAAATAAGAIAGGVVGNNAERNSHSSAKYEIYLRMDDGRRIVVSQRDLNGVREGSYIRIRNGQAYLN